MKNIFIFATMVTLALPVIASDASKTSVTLYGIADAGYVRVSNVKGDSRQGIDSGWLQPSRFGFRGSEDLGGGLRAIFTLESGVNIDTGANTSSTSFFNRQAFVGLTSNSLGTLTLGRQYTLIFDNLFQISGSPAFGFSGGAVDGLALPGSSAGRFDNTLGGTRIDNSIKYTSATASGIQLNAMTGFGEIAGSSSAKQLWAIGAKYKQGPVYAGLSYQIQKCAEQGGCTTAKDNDKLFAIGGGYDFGPAKLFAIFTRENNAKNIKNTDGDTAQVIVQIPVGNWLFGAGYQQLNDKTTLNQDVKQYNLSVLNYLSKRTTAYAALSLQNVSNGGKASMAMTNSDNNKQNAFALGVRHTF
ncbi:porin [Comamonas sp. J-3]|uniref:porin n=1 Tax=Comamonas trifloxystrobinivorans TaxID=3350256 RepID=UPI00372C4D23